MKKLLLTLTAMLACVAAFGQGRVSFNNDTLHLVYFTTDPSGLAPGDAALAGQPMYGATTIAGSPLLVADLYSASTSGGLVLVKSTTFTNSVSAGKWSPASTTLPIGEPSGQTAFFQIQIHDSRDADAAASAAAGHYYGTSPVFSLLPGATSFVNLYQSTSPVFSSWPVGTFNMDSTSPGDRGAISLQVIPEPTTFALAGLGAAALLIFRRRK